MAFYQANRLHSNLPSLLWNPKFQSFYLYSFRYRRSETAVFQGDKKHQGDPVFRGAFGGDTGFRKQDGFAAVGRRFYLHGRAYQRGVYRFENIHDCSRRVAFNSYHFARRTCRRDRVFTLPVKTYQVPRARIRAYNEYRAALYSDAFR